MFKYSVQGYYDELQFCSQLSLEHIKVMMEP